MQKLGTAIDRAVVSATQVFPHGSAPAKAVIRYDANNLPAIVNRRTDLEIPSAVWSSWIPSSGPREIRRPLTGDEREALQARAAELAPALEPYPRPSEDDRVALAIADMFGGFRSMREQGEDVLGRVQSAMRALSRFPVWAIERGCLSIQQDGYEVEDRDGKRVERHWPPSDPEISQAVERIVEMRRKALISAENLLSAPVEPPPPPRPTKSEVEAILGRQIVDRDTFTTALPPAPPGDGKHAERVAADLAARKARNEARAEHNKVDQDTTSTT